MNEYPLSHGLAERLCQTSMGRGEESLEGSPVLLLVFQFARARSS